ncbi:MAG: efflux RND transporter periplasmic adaptor subunit [Pseudomonadota bacterium]
MVIEAHETFTPAQEPKPALWHRITAGALKALIPLAILAVAVPYANHLYTTGPVAERKSTPRVPRLVEVIEVTPTLKGPLIEAWGEVAPAQTLSLRPEVSGTVVELNPSLTPGGEIDAGEPFLRIDDRSLKLAVAEAEAEIAEIKARILIEEGQAARAERDAARSGLQLTDAQRVLVLREPQMAQLKAELAAAEAARDQAKINLAKSQIVAPGDMLVITEEIARGGSVSAGTEVAELVALDKFHVNVAVPVGAMHWLNLRDRATVRLTQPGVWPEGTYREGRVLRSKAALSQTGRMVEVVVEVTDPLNHQPANEAKPEILLGSYVQAEFEGRPIAKAVELDRNYLRENSNVWVMLPDGTLDIRPVVVAWLGAERVLISGGLEPGERVVTTNLAVSAPGMKLRTADGPEAHAASALAPAESSQ